MNTKNALLGLIIVTAASFSLAFALRQAYVIVACSLVVSLIWLILEMNRESAAGYVFLPLCLGLALWGIMSDAPMLLILLGFSTSLAAWDLSLFRGRFIARDDTKALLEVNHLRKLALTASAGFLIALLPVTVQISIPFAIFFLIVPLAMLALRKSIMILRNKAGN